MSDSKKDQPPSKIKRRSFLKAIAALASSGALAWGVSKLPDVDAEEVIIGVDAADPLGDETVISAWGGRNAPMSYFGPSGLTPRMPFWEDYDKNRKD